MTALAYDLPPDALDSPAARGLRHFTPESQRRALVRFLAAVDRGEDHVVAAYLGALRRCEGAPPTYDTSTYTTLASDEWETELGSGVNASDEGGEAQ